MELPSSFYYTIGILIFTQVSAIGTFIAFGGRSLWWLSKLDSRVEDNRQMAIRAHKRIDVLEKTEPTEGE